MSVIKYKYKVYGVFYLNINTLLHTNTYKQIDTNSTLNCLELKNWIDG